MTKLDGDALTREWDEWNVNGGDPIRSETRGNALMRKGVNFVNRLCQRKVDHE